MSIHKYRAWLLDENRMIDPVIQINFAKPHPTIAWYEDMHDALSGKLTDAFMDRTVLMQYTGLKNIYDGDVVTAREKSNTAIFTGYVHFENGQYWVNYIGYESYYVPLIQLVNAEYEPIKVIGNVHSDPHLLGGNQT